MDVFSTRVVLPGSKPVYRIGYGSKQSQMNNRDICKWRDRIGDVITCHINRRIVVRDILFVVSTCK